MAENKMSELFKNIKKSLMNDAQEDDIGFLAFGYTPEAIVSIRSPLGDGIQIDKKYMDADQTTIQKKSSSIRR